jgi:hypothetical protein
MMKSKLFQWLLLGAFCGAAMMLNRSCTNGDAAPILTTAEPQEDSVGQSVEAEEPNTEESRQVSNDRSTSVQSTANQGLVSVPDHCGDPEICTRDWALQTLGVALQVRADTLLIMARENGYPEEWLTQHLAANHDLLRQESKSLGLVLDGSARQNEIASQRTFEIAATSIAIQMQQTANGPTSDLTSVANLLRFTEAQLAEQFAKFPHLTAEARTQIQEALPTDGRNNLAESIAQSVGGANNVD